MCPFRDGRFYLGVARSAVFGGGIGLSVFDDLRLETQNAVPVPEPAMLILLGTGLASAAFKARRRGSRREHVVTRSEPS